MSTLQQRVLLKPYTSFKVGGAAQYFATVSSVEELQAVLHETQSLTLPTKVLGGGTNLLIADDGVAAVVIKNEITGIEYQASGDSVTATVGAGEVLDDCIAAWVTQGYWGLENLSHIPGSIGATPIQNVGAYGVEVADCISAVHAVNQGGVAQVFSNAECQFGYRDSYFKTPEGSQWIVTHVAFTLSKRPQPKLHYRDLQERFADTTPSLSDVRAAIIAIRGQKFPDWTTVGTAGSFFKNPIIPRSQYDTLLATYPDVPCYEVSDTHVKVPLGWILDKVCDLKGWQHGLVGTYAGQALVLVAEPNATAKDIIATATEIMQRVKAETGIDIVWEVTRW